MTGKTLVEIIWMDAAAKLSAPKEYLPQPEELLVEQTTYGRIYEIDDNAITICTHENEDEIDYIVIPNKWIKEIKKYAHRKPKKSP